MLSFSSRRAFTRTVGGAVGRSSGGVKSSIGSSPSQVFYSSLLSSRPAVCLALDSIRYRQQYQENSPKKMSFHFGSNEYASCFAGIPIPDTNAIRTSSLEYLKTFDIQQWYDDPVSIFIDFPAAPFLGCDSQPAFSVTFRWLRFVLPCFSKYFFPVHVI